MYAAPASMCPGSGPPQDALYLKALCNVKLVYRQAQKLSGIRCYADFDSLPHTLRRFYVKTALEQFENFDGPAAALFQEKLADMSRFRTIPDWQSQDFPCHGLPYVPFQPGQGQHDSSFGAPHQNLPLHHGHHHDNLAATPPMPLPMVDSPFPAAPPPTPVSMYTPGPHGGGDMDEYTWASSSYSTSGSLSTRTGGGSGGFKSDPSSPFRLSYDNMNMDIGTVSPQDLHPELEYAHLNSMGMFPMTTEELGSMSMFPLSDTEILAPVSAPAAATMPLYSTTAAIRRPLPSAAPSSFIHRKPSSAAPSRGSVSTAVGHTGLTASSHSSKRRAHANEPRSSGSGSGRSCHPITPVSIPEGTFVSGHHTVPVGPPPMPAQTQFQGQVSGFPPPLPPSIIPSNNNRPSASGPASGRDVEVATISTIENIPAKSSSHRSSRKKSSSQAAEHQSPSSTNKFSPLRKKKTGGGSKTSSSSQQQPTVPSPPLFPPGQNRPGFVPIGRLGVASVAQGNTHPLDLALKKRIIVAERDAGLTYKAIKNKYTRWREAESTYRGLDRTARLPLEYRERVASWSEQHIQSLRRGMAILRDPMRPNLKGFPWKQLADYIKAETGKPFGATTAKKKWFEIAAEGDEDEIDDEDGDEDEDEEMEG